MRAQMEAPLNSLGNGDARPVGLRGFPSTNRDDQSLFGLFGINGLMRSMKK